MHAHSQTNKNSTPQSTAHGKHHAQPNPPPPPPHPHTNTHTPHPQCGTRTQTVNLVYHLGATMCTPPSHTPAPPPPACPPTCLHAPPLFIQLKLQAIKLVDAQRLKGMLDQRALGQPAQHTAADKARQGTAQHHGIVCGECTSTEQLCHAAQDARHAAKMEHVNGAPELPVQFSSSKSVSVEAPRNTWVAVPSLNIGLNDSVQGPIAEADTPRTAFGD